MARRRPLPLAQRAALLLALLGAFTLVLVLDALSGGALTGYGVRPRSLTGLRGIVFAPFLHGGWTHLAANSVPFVVLGGLVLLQDTRRFVLTTLFAAVGAGLVAWGLGAPQSVHIGASGLVFGYLGFLLSQGWFDRQFGTLLLGLAVAFVWGGLVFGVLPGQAGVSWQSHAGGFAGGLWAAHRTAPPRRRPRTRPSRRP
jgi:membrane associated rhomboid family serine protease